MSTFPIDIKDHLSRPIHLEQAPKRIISLVPSITELLFALQLDNEIVGRTSFCVYPANQTKSVPKIGGTKTVNIEKVKKLKPDLIIANKEENIQSVVEELAKFCPVFVSSIQTIHSAVQLIEDIGLITNRKTLADQLQDFIEIRRSQWHQVSRRRKSCIYLIWKDPNMTIGMDTFIFHMLQEAGFESVIHDYRYPEISEQTIIESSAEYLLLSNEPYPFAEKHKKEWEAKTNKKVVLVDGSYFSWYGSRLLEAYDYFEKCISTLD